MVKANKDMSQDLNVVRSTLHLDAASEEEALRAFRADFNESLRNAWTISLDWWFHMMNQRRDNDCLVTLNFPN